MNAISEWLKTFLLLYFFLTLVLYLVPKESYRKYLKFAIKTVLLLVLFLPLLNRIGKGEELINLIKEIEAYRQEEDWQQQERMGDLQSEYIEERSEYYKAHFGESE
jgi:stage III sporulation protein AF